MEVTGKPELTSKPIEQLQAFIPYIEELRNYPDIFWEQPIAPGKWTLKELVCHLWNWDRYSVDTMVPIMGHGALLPAFVDVEEHNAEARVLARSFASPADLVEAFVGIRTALIRQIAEKYDSQVRFTIGGGKRKYSYDSYMEIFTHHDEQHKEQIEEMKRNVPGIQSDR